MEKLRLGIVGLGHRGREMFSMAAKVFDDLEAVAACDLNPALWFETARGRSEPLAQSMPGVKFYEDYRQMLGEAKPDVVLVETPANCHAEFCAAALSAGVHVYSDIPTVNSIEEAQMLWDIHLKSNALIMTGATTLGWGFVLAMQDFHRQGMLGKPFYLEAEYIHDIRCLWGETPWRKTYLPIRYCTHSLGPLLSIMDEDLREVSCLNTGSHVTDFKGANDLMTAHFRTKSDVVARLTVSFVNNAGCGCHSYRVFGTEGYFEHLSARGAQGEKTFVNSNKLCGMDKLTELPVGFTPSEVEKMQQASPHAAFGHGGAETYLWNSFIRAIRSGAKTTSIPLKESLRMTLPGIYAAESAADGGNIKTIHYPWDNRTT
jgi:predicted dehydrogenase